MRYPAGNSEPAIRVRSVDGTPYRITADSISEYLLHPVFLRFFACAVLICALLDGRPMDLGLQGWSLVFAWACVSCLGLVWLALGASFARRAVRRGWITQVYTPLLLLPLVFLADLAMQAVAVALGAGDWKDLSFTLQHVARDMVIVGLFDLLHAHAVVWAHPLAHPETASRAELPPEAVAAPPAQPSTPAPVALPAPPAEPTADRSVMVQIGPATLPLSSILFIRTEDHYLGVTTHSGKALHRAKMADIPELHSGIAGLQINRSVWVAFAAIRSVNDAENRQIVVTLVTGDEERVARPRTFAFRQSYAKYLATRSPG